MPPKELINQDSEADQEDSELQLPRRRHLSRIHHIANCGEICFVVPLIPRAEQKRRKSLIKDIYPHLVVIRRERNSSVHNSCAVIGSI